MLIGDKSSLSLLLIGHKPNRPNFQADIKLRILQSFNNRKFKTIPETVYNEINTENELLNLSAI